MGGKKPSKWKTDTQDSVGKSMPSNHFNRFYFEWLHPGRAARVLLFTGLAVYKTGFTLKTS